MGTSYADLRVDAAMPAMVNLYRMAGVAQAMASTRFPNSLPLLEQAYQRVIPFERGRVFGMVASNDEDAVLAFRGSDANREWLAALSYGQIAGPTGRVHEGIYAALADAETPLMAALFDADALEKRLWIGGHSLGGALAALACLRLHAAGFEPYFTATFGAPAVMDRAAAAAMPGRVYRVVNGEDVVAEMDWPTMFDTYVHGGELVRLLPSGAIAASRHSAGLALRLDRADGIGVPLPRSGMIHDHMIAAYVGKLGALAAEG